MSVPRHSCVYSLIAIYSSCSLRPKALLLLAVSLMRSGVRFCNITTVLSLFSYLSALTWGNCQSRFCGLLQFQPVWADQWSGFLVQPRHRQVPAMCGKLQNSRWAGVLSFSVLTPPVTGALCACFPYYRLSAVMTSLPGAALRSSVELGSALYTPSCLNYCSALQLISCL